MRPLSYRTGTQYLWNLKCWLAVEACDFEYPVGRQMPHCSWLILFMELTGKGGHSSRLREVLAARDRACKARVS